MKKKIQIITFALVFVLSGFSVAGQETVYFCSKVGTTLTYNNYAAKNKYEGYTKDVIKRSYVRNDTLFMESYSTIYDPDSKVMTRDHSNNIAYYINKTTYYIIDPIALFTDEEKEAMKKKGVTISKAAFDINDSWSSGKSLSDLEVVLDLTVAMEGPEFKICFYNTDRKFEGKETVSTEAGDIECAKISYNLKMKLGPIRKNIGRQIDWYAPGIGLVKMELWSGKKLKNTKILKSIVN